MTELEGQILHWESVLKESRHLLSPSTEAIIEGTIRSLKKLKKLQEGE